MTALPPGSAPVKTEYEHPKFLMQQQAHARKFTDIYSLILSEMFPMTTQQKGGQVMRMRTETVLLKARKILGLVLSVENLREKRRRAGKVRTRDGDSKK